MLLRERAIGWIAGAGFLLGLPPALHMSFLDHRDWAWGVVLMLSGLYYSLAGGRYGAAKSGSSS